MALSTADLTHVLLAVVALLVAAHLGGHLFRLIHQPQVIGEIAGGLVLGPTVLGALAPSAQRWLLPTTGPTAAVLGAVYHLGLLFLVHLTGTELRRRGSGAQVRTIGLIAGVGLILPFLFGLGIARVADLRGLSGPAGSPMTLTMVFGMAIAVTSVPVISRIMLDVGILGTVFARIVLAVAVIEDIALYVILAIVLGVAQAEASDAYGLWSLLGTDSLPLAGMYFTLVPLTFIAAMLRWGPRAFARLSAARFNAVAERSPLAFRLVFLFLMCAACAGLGIDPIFGALVAGMCDADAVGRKEHDSQEVLRSFSLAFFIPVYFAMVGVKLDLAHHFDLLFFCWFFALACAAKLFSVWLGARLAHETNSAALHLAVALNARGGPGIVLASVALGAHVINESFFTSLVLLSVLTSQLAGLWLGRAVARGHVLSTGVPPIGHPPADRPLTARVPTDHAPEGAKNDSPA